MKCSKCGKDLIIVKSQSTIVSTRDYYDVYHDTFGKESFIHFIHTNHKTDDSEIEYQEYSCYHCGDTDIDNSILEALYKYENSV